MENLTLNLHTTIYKLLLATSTPVGDYVELVRYNRASPTLSTSKYTTLITSPLRRGAATRKLAGSVTRPRAT